MPNTLSHQTEFFGVVEARVSAMLTDPSPLSHAITAVTNTGTTVTATIDDTSAMYVGAPVKVSGIIGFTTNNPNGNFTVATIVSGTQFTYVVTAAPTGAYGSGGTASFAAIATYSASVDVPGINSVGMTPAFIKKSSRGAGQALSTRSKKDVIAVTFQFAELSLDAMAVMTGDAVVATGTDPNSVVTYTDNDTGVSLPFFKFEARTDAVDTVSGDGHIILYKVVMDAENIGFTEDDFHKFSAGGTAVRRKSDNRRRQIILNQTAALVA